MYCVVVDQAFGLQLLLDPSLEAYSKSILNNMMLEGMVINVDDDTDRLLISLFIRVLQLR